MTKSTEVTYDHQPRLGPPQTEASTCSRVSNSGQTAKLQALRPTDQKSVAHLTLDPQQEQFAGNLTEVFDELKEHRYPGAEHPFAILDEQYLVGFFILREGDARPEWTNKDAVTLHSFRVGGLLQGRGYGRQGVSLAVKWVLDNRPSATQLMLAVNQRNQQALDFYTRCGFWDTGRTHMGPIGEQSVLALNIEQNP